MRQQNAAFFLETLPQLHGKGIEEATFFATLDTLAATQLRATVSYLAANIPQYRVLFTGEQFEVIGPLDPAAQAQP